MNWKVLVSNLCEPLNMFLEMKNTVLVIKNDTSLIFQNRNIPLFFLNWL